MTHTPATLATAVLLDGLSDLPPTGRIAAHGRLIEELRASIARQRAAIAQTEELLAAVIEAVEAPFRQGRLS